jgi:hypothetical protein
VNSILIIASLTAIGNFKARYTRIQPKIKVKIHPVWSIFIFPLSLALGIIVPTAELHTIAHNDFAAGFRIREWQPIFRANWSGFVLAYLVSMVAGFVLTFIVQVATITIVLICVLPFIMPAITFYITLVMYTAFAQAYKDGKDRLAQ